MASKLITSAKRRPEANSRTHRFERSMPAMAHTPLLQRGKPYTRRLSSKCRASSPTRDGSFRRVVVRRPREQIHTQVLHAFARRAIVDPGHLLDRIPAVNDFKFPMQEFRTLALNAVGKLGFLDRGVWNRFKVQLCHLLLLFIHKEGLAAPSASPNPGPASSLAGPPEAAATGARPDTSSPDTTVSRTQQQQLSACDLGVGQEAEQQGADRARDMATASFHSALEEIIDRCLDRDLQHLAKISSDPSIPDDQRGCVQGKYDARRRNLAQQVTKWCEAIVQQPDFHHVKPFLSQVLDIQPTPLYEQSGRDGRQTEDLVYRLVERELPAGWRLYSGARLLKIGEDVFPNQKFLKGEADLLLTDPDGVVQAVLEVKTASGNLFLALSEDVIRFLALMDRVRGQEVTFSLSDSTRMTLKFSPHLRPIYVLGCELHPEDLEAVARSAQMKLLTMEVGRMLSSQIHAWGSIASYEFTPSVAMLQLAPEVLPQLRSNVYSYFQTLAGCEIFTLQRSAWSQRETLEADELLEHGLPMAAPQASSLQVEPCL